MGWGYIEAQGGIAADTYPNQGGAFPYRQPPPVGDPWGDEDYFADDGISGRKRFKKIAKKVTKVAKPVAKIAARAAAAYFTGGASELAFQAMQARKKKGGVQRQPGEEALLSAEGNIGPAGLGSTLTGGVREDGGGGGAPGGGGGGGPMGEGEEGLFGWKLGFSPVVLLGGGVLVAALLLRRK